MVQWRLTTKDRWRPHEGSSVKFILFKDIFLEYLERSKNKVCLEIGCMPGVLLAYICKNFGYFAEGIDYIEGSRQITERALKENGISQYNIYEADFVTWSPPKQYDLVCSFGFVEHFTGLMLEEVVKKHIQLVKPGGKIMLDVPNYNYGQYFIHSILDAEDLKRHNTECMMLSYFRNVASEYNLKIIYLSFYGGIFKFWASFRNLNFIQKLLYCMLKLIELAVKKTPLVNLNNRFFSPFIVFIAEKQC